MLFCRVYKTQALVFHWPANTCIYCVTPSGCRLWMCVSLWFCVRQQHCRDCRRWCRSKCARSFSGRVRFSVSSRCICAVMHRCSDTRFLLQLEHFILWPGATQKNTAVCFFMSRLEMFLCSCRSWICKGGPRAPTCSPDSASDTQRTQTQWWAESSPLSCSHFSVFVLGLHPIFDLKKKMFDSQPF